MQAEVGGGSALQQAQQEAVEEEEDPYALPAGVPPVTDLTQLIQPLDSEAKALMPNCTRCRGCSVELSEIHTSLNTFGDGVTFVHGKGATNGWLFFAKVAGSSTRHIVKVNCMPYSKLKGPAKMQECFARVYLSRFQLIMGQRELAEDCGVAELTPRTWLAPVNAIAPKGCKGFGYHIRWHGLWSEEAQGITLHGLYMARKDDLAMSLMAEKMNRTQVVLGAIMDLFTAQCDRHSENVFIRADGGLQFIDNDRALGVVTRCGADSMLLPGTRYHGMLRTGLFHHTQAFYKQNMHKPGFCHGPVDARVLMDYRCYVPNGLIGKSFPPNMQRCLESVARSTIPQIIQRYGLPREKKPALILQHRATDLLRHGFEWTLSNGPPISAAKFRQVHQTPCCALQRSRQFVTCDKCWKPIFDLMDNSTAPEDDPQFAQLP